MVKNRIENQVELNNPPDRVWQALTDSKQFGEWFRVKLHSAFVEGKKTRGHITYPGFEHLIFEVDVQKIELERYFSFFWHPYAVDPKINYSSETPTLVEFHLERKPEGVLLKLTESGFDNIPAHRREEAYKMNDRGWAEQMKNIKAFLTDH